MAWFYATSVSVTNGATVVSVNAGDDIAIIQPGDGLVIGTQPPVEIKRTYLDGGSNKKIELLKPWPYGSQTNQTAVAFPTDGDLAAATAVLKQLIDGFTLATQAEAQAGTENTKPMTALRVKQAMDALLGTASKLTATTSTTDTVQGRAMRSWDYGLGALAGPTELNPGAVRQTRMMSVNASWDGSPIPGVDAGNQGQLLQMQHGDPTYAIQVLYSLLSSAGDLTRRISNNVAGPWARNITSANMVGTVAAQGEAPALFSAVIERGSNSNGQFVKFADGTLICWSSRSTTLSMAPYSSGLYVGDFIWFFPAQFNGGVGPVCGSHADSVTKGWVSCSALSTTQATINCYSASSGNSGTLTLFSAIGRWR